MSKRTLIFFDCQTNGTGRSSQIIEAAWQITLAQRVISSESHLIRLNEDQTLPKRITRLTGISETTLQSGISEYELYVKLKEITKSCVTPVYWVIHYLQFEKPYLQRLFEKYDDSDGRFLGEFICTHKLAKSALAHLPSFSIHAVSGHLGYSVEKFKRAPEHVAATVFIWNKLQTSSPTTTKKFDRYLSLIDKKTRDTWPQKPGVYRMYAKDNKLLYVGKAKNLSVRLNSYFRGRKSKGSRLNEMLSQVDSIETEVLDSEAEAILVECLYIDRDKPKYNIALTSDKPEPIKINELAISNWPLNETLYTLPSGALSSINEWAVEFENTFLGELFTPKQFRQQLKLLASDMFNCKRLPGDISAKISFLLKRYWHLLQLYDTTDFHQTEIDWEQLFEDDPEQYLYENLHRRFFQASIELQRAKWLHRLSECTVTLGVNRPLKIRVSASKRFIELKGRQTLTSHFDYSSASFSRSGFNKLATLLSLLKSSAKTSKLIKIVFFPLENTLSREELAWYLTPLIY